jgi:hypothetical protein
VYIVLSSARVHLEQAVAITDQFLRIHPQVAVRVVHQPGVRGLADQHAAI